MLTKSRLKEIFAKYGFTPLKRLGENYLIDNNIKDKVIAAAFLSKDDVVLEIGPGFGALTMDIARSAGEVFAVEKDKKAYNILKDLAITIPNLKIFNEDILEFDIEKMPASKKIKVIGNLPYYVTTPIMEYIIENRQRINFVVMTIQKEVARRFLARPGTKDYGSISCYVQYYMRPKYIYTVKRNSFYPAPDVDSSLIKLDVLAAPPVEVKDETLFFKIIRGAFNQRRKSIINSLSREEVLDMPKEELSRILNGLAIEPSVRAETLGLAQFASISNAI